MRHLIQTACILASGALLVTGCAGGGSGGNRVPGTVDVHEVELRDPSTLHGPERSGPSTVETFSEETREFMAGALRKFSQNDPGWPRARAQWLGMGQRESEFLVYMLWTGLVRMQQLAQPANVERARHELALIGEPSVPMLAAVLSGGTAFSVYDEIDERDVDVPIDDTARREAAEILTIIGAPAVSSLAEVLERAETKSGQKFAIQALGNMGDGGGAYAGATLVAWAGSEDWIVRVEAVQAMRTRSDGATAAALIAALRDDESLVREKAADALARRMETSAIGALTQAAARARGEGKLRESKRHERALKAIRGAR